MQSCVSLVADTVPPGMYHNLRGQSIILAQQPSVRRDNNIKPDLFTLALISSDMAGFLSSAAISQFSDELPSVFPLLALDQLKSSMRAAFSHVTT